MQIAGNAFAFILPDGDFRKDLFPLQPHITTMVPDDGNKEVYNDSSDNYREENGDIQDLVFHFCFAAKNTIIYRHLPNFPLLLQTTGRSYFNVNFCGAGISRKAIA